MVYKSMNKAFLWLIAFMVGVFMILMGIDDANAASLGKVAIKSISSTETSVKITYGKVSGASGYQIYRSDSKGGKYSKVGTTSSLFYTNSKLKVNRGYYYKVRAYKKSGSKYTYGGFSSVKYIKTKNHTWKAQYRKTDKGYYEKSNFALRRTFCNVCGKEVSVTQPNSHFDNHKKQGFKTTPNYVGYTETKVSYKWVPKVTNTLVAYKCSGCGAVKHDKHDWVPQKGVASSVRLENVKYKKLCAICNVCGKDISSNPSAHLSAHNNTTWKEVYKDSVLKVQVEEKSYSICGYKCSWCGASK